MEVLYPHCAGLDVHKNSVVACARHMSGGKVSTKVRTFKTTTEELLALLVWLTDQDITHIAMEATGVYWKPVWHILSDDDFVMVLANAAHVKNVPGRKTDVNDAHPEGTGRRHIKLDSVVTDLLGLSGRRILDALVKGQTTPAGLAALADGRIHATAEELTAALHGRVTSHHRFLVKLHLDHIAAIAQAIASIDKEVDSQVEPFRQPAQMVSAIPGLGPLAALVVLAEIGLDMSHFPSAAHLISWAGLCPRNDESAGKRRSTRMRNGAPWLKTVLIQCAWSAARTKGSYFQSLYHRLRSRRGAKKAIGAVAASLLTTIYHMLKNGTLYEDLGANYFDQKARERQAMRLITRLHTLGYQVHIEQMAT